MALMYIQEYARIQSDGKGNTVQAGHEPALASQYIAYTTTAGPSASFNKETRFIRVSLNTAGHVAFGIDPTAVTLQSMPMAADTPEYFAVIHGQKVSAVI